ncbi:MAG: hypothetical protein A2428_07480 [Bdellovibrionales bacterium RIFOXYC1_FULL_54_43]|nr:MAG: hypothetical protein A2428_07480 [Bdellovibrionales bacterium RIFOXYC1_FULL_54_43]OFZ83783.1 MAG: hypothetical protein A2603_12675 [Bdellovibrionales bacterium RIFOXYD1_FULL_55_31]
METVPEHATEISRLKISSSLICDYALRAVANPSSLVLLLHGYLQSGPYLFKKLEPLIPASAIVLAPNAPFPVPVKLKGKPGEIPKGTESGFRLGFSWYFYDPSKDDYYIDMESSVEYLKALVRALGYEELPKILVGYSQGGYVAPFAGQAFRRVTRVLGISCQFLDEEIRGAIPFRMDAIHGLSDDWVDAEVAERSHRALVNRGVEGEFILLRNSGHRITSEMADAISEQLHES